jgi:hypothetical protein
MGRMLQAEALSPRKSRAKNTSAKSTKLFSFPVAQTNAFALAA